MWTFETGLLVAGTFFLAGLVKGVVGLGLPTVALGLLTTVLGLTPAIALMLIPGIATNAAQAVGGPDWPAILRRFWPLLVMVCLGVWLGAGVLAGTTSNAPAVLLGLLIAMHATVSLLAPSIPSPARHERWLSPVVGLVNGLVTGLTGSAIIPGLIYMQALGLKKEQLVQAMGMLFGTSTLVLALAFARHELLTPTLALVSTLALVPAFAGMALGRKVRLRISEERFRRWLLLSLLALGIYVAWRSWG